MAGVVVTFTVTSWRRNYVVQYCDYQHLTAEPLER